MEDRPIVSIVQVDGVANGARHPDNSIRYDGVENSFYQFMRSRQSAALYRTVLLIMNLIWIGAS